jgi:hypothetical protein
MLSRRAAIVFGVVHTVTAVLVLGGVFAGLPSRWWPVDSSALVVGLSQLAAGVALLGKMRKAGRLALVASGIGLAFGMILVTLLAWTASWLSGVYGPVGKGGALALALVGALALPYLVVVPALELYWLRAKGSQDDD